jgi:hypothetical protein
MPILLAVALAASPSIVQMKWERRVLIVAAPSAGDASLAEQRRVLARWKANGDARDLTIVEVVGDTVRGAADTAAQIRRKYHLPAPSPRSSSARTAGKNCAVPSPSPPPRWKPRSTRCRCARLASDRVGDGAGRSA